VIVANRLWTYDTGASTVEKDDHGQEVQRFKADPILYNLDSVWKQRAESFRPGGADGWLASRPRSYDDQSDWLLERALLGEDPISHADQEARCRDFDKVLALLWKKLWLDDGTLKLTDAGRQHIEKRLLVHRRRLPAPDRFEVRVELTIPPEGCLTTHMSMAALHTATLSYPATRKAEARLSNFLQRAAKSPSSREPPRRQDAKFLNFLAPWRLGGCFFGFLAGR
jgi:hypothetical protein